MNTNTITIVGGGSSGWMTAAFLIRTFPEKEITVIESSNIPIIGVGESTLIDFTNFRDYLGIEEKDFMKKTNASYKMSIKFTDFYDKDAGSFHYPFKKPELSDTRVGIYDWLDIKTVYPTTPVDDFVRCYYPHAALFESNKFSKNENGEFGNFNAQTDVAYHFDATLFGQWLKKEYCMPRNVRVINADVINVNTSDIGVKSLILDSGEEIVSDLFIDCTGFSSLLLGQSLGEEFDSFSHILPNNKAIAAQLPYKDKEKELEPFTNCTAIENGWCWNVPLWSRLGTGYVYSDKYVSFDQAKEEFIKYLKSDKMIIPRSDDDLNDVVFRDIPMKVGIYKRTWVKNVVAIGLSAGFIEPLESNALFTVLWFLRRLGKSVLRGTVTQGDRDVYNTATRGMYNNFAEFVALHYALTVRDDTEYWKDISEKTFCNNMVSLIPSHTVGFFDLHNKKMFNPTIDPVAGITYISVGMNYPLKDKLDQEMELFGYYDGLKQYVDGLITLYNYKKEKWQDAAKKCPTLYQYLKSNIYFED